MGRGEPADPKLSRWRAFFGYLLPRRGLTEVPEAALAADDPARAAARGSGARTRVFTRLCVRTALDRARPCLRRRKRTGGRIHFGLRHSSLRS